MARWRHPFKNIGLIILLFAAASGLSHGQKEPEKPEAAPYTRYEAEEEGGRLDSAIVSFTSEDGIQVDLIAAVHIGEKSYFAELNKRFEAYDAVLFEMVGGSEGMTPESLAARPKTAVGSVQGALTQLLALEFQLDAIRYDAPNFVHADMSKEEFAEEQSASGESILTLVERASSQQAENGEARSFTMTDLFRVLSSPDQATEMRLLLAPHLANADSLIQGVEAMQDSVILSGRNRVVIEKLKEVLTSGKRKVAIFYGAAHMPALAETLRTDLGMTRGDEEWLTAWTMERKGPTPVRAGAE